MELETCEMAEKNSGSKSGGEEKASFSIDSLLKKKIEEIGDESKRGPPRVIPSVPPQMQHTPMSVAQFISQMPIGHAFFSPVCFV